MSVPSRPPNSLDYQSGFNKGYTASSCSPVHSMSLGLDPMIFCQYCGWMASHSPPRCAHCPASTESALKRHQIPLQMEPDPSHATSGSFQETLTVSSSPDPQNKSCPASRGNEPAGSREPSKSQNPPASSSCVSLQPAEGGPATFPVSRYLTLTLEKPARPPTLSLPSQRRGSDQGTPVLHPCRFCKLTFTAPYLLLHHTEARHKHPCNMCPRTFHRGLELAQHQAYSHLVARPCSLIGAASSNPGPARTTNSGSVRKTKKPRKSKQSLVCQACSRHFRSSDTLQKHRCNPQHTQCTSCGKYFGSKILLRQHSKQDNCSRVWREGEETESKAVPPLDSPQTDGLVYPLSKNDSSYHSSGDTKTPICTANTKRF